MPHRPAQPGIGARRRRPHALDQSAGDDAVGLDQSRFQRAVDVKRSTRPLRSPHRTIGECGLEHLGIIGQRHQQAALRLLGEQVVEGGGKRKARLPLERPRNAVGVSRQSDQQLAMPRSDLGEIVGPRRRETFHRRQCWLQRGDQRVNAIEHGILKPRPHLRSMQQRRFLFAKLGELIPETCEIQRQPLGASLRPRPAQQRQFERLDRSTVRASRRAEPAQRMLEQREQCRRLQAVCGGFRHQPCKNSSRSLDQHIAAGIVEVQIPAFQCGHHPPRQRTVGRHQRGRFLQMSGLAHRNCDCECLHFRIGRFDHREVLHAVGDMRGDFRPRQSIMPLRRCVGRTHRLRQQHVAPANCGRLENLDIAAADAEALEEGMHGKLRMARCGMFGEAAFVVALAADALPRAFVELGIEPRQNDGALRQLCNHVQEFCGRRHRSGRTGRDHRAGVMGGEAFGFRIDQKIAPRRRFDLSDFGKIFRPRLSRDLQELERELPILIEGIRHQPIQRLPSHAARDHVVHQPREIAGQRQRRSRTADHERRRTRALRPRRHQPRKRQPALQFAKSGRQLQRGGSATGILFLGENQFVFVDVAERHDARQQHGLCAELFEKDFPHQPSGTAGGKIERGFGQPFRLRACRKALDQPAVDQRRDNGAQERHGRGNVEDAHGLPDSKIRLHHGMGLFGARIRRAGKGEGPYATLSRNASSAAAIASGVPTCIQVPSSLSPNSRSCSLAASNILVSENSPLGAPANTTGEIIATPA